MLFRNKWREVFFTMDMEAFFRAKNVLREQNVDFREKMTDNNMKTALFSLGGRTPAQGRTSFVKNYYRILVCAENEEYARFLLKQI